MLASLRDVFLLVAVWSMEMEVGALIALAKAKPYSSSLRKADGPLSCYR